MTGTERRENAFGSLGRGGLGEAAGLPALQRFIQRYR